MSEDNQKQDNNSDKISFVDYFNPNGVEYTLELEGDQKLFFKKMNENARAWFQDQNSEVEYNRKTQNIKMKAGIGSRRINAIKKSLTNWRLKTKGNDGSVQDVPYSKENVNRFLESLQPEIADRIFDKVKEYNPWLDTEDADREDLEKQKEELEERIKSLDSKEKK